MALLDNHANHLLDLQQHVTRGGLRGRGCDRDLRWRGRGHAYWLARRRDIAGCGCRHANRLRLRPLRRSGRRDWSRVGISGRRLGIRLVWQGNGHAGDAPFVVQKGNRYSHYGFQPRNVLSRRGRQIDRGGSGSRAGPWMTVLSASNIEPWHGQSQVRSALFQVTVQPLCVQLADTACRSPWSGPRRTGWGTILS